MKKVMPPPISLSTKPQWMMMPEKDKMERDTEGAGDGEVKYLHFLVFVETFELVVRVSVNQVTEEDLEHEGQNHY